MLSLASVTSSGVVSDDSVQNSFCCLDIGSCYAAQAGLEFMIHLSQHPECWNCKCLASSSPQDLYKTIKHYTITKVKFLSPYLQASLGNHFSLFLKWCFGTALVWSCNSVEVLGSLPIRPLSGRFSGAFHCGECTKHHRLFFRFYITHFSVLHNYNFKSHYTKLSIICFIEACMCLCMYVCECTCECVD